MNKNKKLRETKPFIFYISTGNQIEEANNFKTLVIWFNSYSDKRRIDFEQFSLIQV